MKDYGQTCTLRKCTDMKAWPMHCTVCLTCVLITVSTENKPENSTWVIILEYNTTRKWVWIIVFTCLCRGRLWLQESMHNNNPSTHCTDWLWLLHCTAFVATGCHQNRVMLCLVRSARGHRIINEAELNGSTDRSSYWCPSTQNQ